MEKWQLMLNEWPKYQKELGSLSNFNQKRVKALYTALSAMSAENRLILAEKYFTKKNKTSGIAKLARSNGVPLSQYQKMLLDAQREFCKYFCPLDQQIDAENEMGAGETDLDSFESIAPTEEVNGKIIFNVKPRGEPMCPVCGTYTACISHNKRKRVFVDVPINGKHVLLRVHRKLLKCLECERYFLPPMPEGTVAKRLTVRAVKYILEEVKHSTLGETAKKVGISLETVRSICHEYMPPEDCKAMMLRNADASRRRKRKPLEK